MVWGFPGSSSGKKIHLQCRRSQLDSWVGKFPRRRDRLPTPVFLSFSGGSDSKESAHNVGDLGSIPGLGRFPGGGHGNPLKHSCLETPHGQGSLAQYSPRGPKELNVTKHSTAHESSSWWCHPAISSSFVPFSSCPQFLPASESFPMSQLFAWGGQSMGVSALALVLPMNTQDWSLLEWTGWISL